MILRYQLVPAGSLPNGVHVTVCEGDLEAVYLIDSGASLQQLCDGLGDVSNEWIRQSWLHVGQLDYDIEKISD